MKNHEYVDGKLLQTNKKYSQLKLKQKEKIHAWMYESYLNWYRKHDRFPDAKCADEVLEPVMARIEAAEIWIPYGQVLKHYHSIVGNLKKRATRTIREKTATNLRLEVLETDFTVCKVADYSQVNLSVPFCFIGKTDQESSLVCPTAAVLSNTSEREDGWKGLRITGTLDFGLTGILARISKILANNEISIFALSTFDTDYVLMKEENLKRGLTALKNAGYEIIRTAEISQ